MDTGGAPSSGPVCGSTSNAWVFMPNLAAWPGNQQKIARPKPANQGGRGEVPHCMFLQ